MTDETFGALEEKIGYRFRDKTLLRRALTHSSYANEMKINKYKDYERLEFLGDAVLELISSEYIFRSSQKMVEGKMTKMRASLVCEMSLAGAARQIHLGEHLYLGKGEYMTGGGKRDSILSDAFEAVIGAIYLDGGFEPAGDFVRKFVLSDIEKKQLFHDSKTILQEMIQEKSHENTHILYPVISEQGPDHDKQFEVCCEINGVKYAKGSGHTKKSAEQMAAYETILLLKNGE